MSPSLRIRAAMLIAALIIGSCGATSEGSMYFVRPKDAWKLKEAVKPSTGQVALTEPSIDWYAEYERFPAPNRSEAVRLSAHQSRILRDELGLGFALRALRVRGQKGFGGTGPDKRPAVVLFDAKPGYAIMALSYELQVEDLRSWMRSLRPASEEEWVDAGGRIVE